LLVAILKYMNTVKVNLDEKLSMFNEFWTPKIVGELNGQHIKLAKFNGEFVWHKHDHEDEMFFVIKGILKIEFRDKTVEIKPNEFLIIPRGVEHKPMAMEGEVSVMLFEPSTTLNTGDTVGDLTKRNLDTI
jgi:mannose-6-phosphate isomerase-like protein (cupin superfamily)